MATAFDTFEQYSGTAYAGLIADRARADVVSMVATGSDVMYGRAVRQTGYREAALPTGSETSTGITVRETVTNNDATDSPLYRQGETMSVIRVGRIWVATVDGAAVGDAVYVVPDTGELTNVDGGGTNIELANAAFKSETDAGGLAVVQLNGTE